MRARRRSLVLLCGALAVTVESRADAIDDYVRATMADQKIPGLVLGMARGGTQHVRTYGIANIEHQVAVKPDTVFQSGSTGKQFTAAVILLLVQDGKLQLDDTLSSHFPGAPPTWRKITVRNLLTHTSGLPDYDVHASFIDMRRDYTEDELAALAMKLPLDFEPGTRWAYSNTGYVMLGILIHRASGQFYGDVLRERIFKPLGMTTARVISESDIIANRAAGYVRTETGVRNQDWVSPSLNTTADGALYLTARDYLKWIEGLRRGRILKPATLELAWKPVRLADGTSYRYGFGWFIEEQRGFISIEHGGSWQGFRANDAYYPEADLAVAVLCNLDACSAGAISRAVAGLVDPNLAFPDPRATPTDPRPARTLTLREVLESWAREQAHPGMAKQLREHPDASPRASSMHKQVAQWLTEPATFHFLAEDDVRSRALERGGEKVDRIVHAGLAASKVARGFRFYLNERGEVLEIGAEGW